MDLFSVSIIEDDGTALARMGRLMRLKRVDRLIHLRAYLLFSISFDGRNISEGKLDQTFEENRNVDRSDPCQKAVLTYDEYSEEGKNDLLLES